MSRNQRRRRVAHRDKEDALKAIEGSVKTLEALNAVYDTGHYDCARDLCVIIERLLQEEVKIAGIRQELRLPSYAHPSHKDNLMPQWSLIGFEMETLDREQEIEGIKFVPVCARGGHSQKWLWFSEWWSQPVYRQGAGGASGLIPIAEGEQIPFKKRRCVARREIIQRTRREIGAHYDKDKSESWNFFSRWNNEIGFEAEYDTGHVWNIRDNPEHFKIANTISDAAIRCISEEVVRGFHKRFDER